MLFAPTTRISSFNQSLKCRLCFVKLVLRSAGGCECFFVLGCGVFAVFFSDYGFGCHRPPNLLKRRECGGLADCVCWKIELIFSYRFSLFSCLLVFRRTTLCRYCLCNRHGCALRDAYQFFSYCFYLALNNRNCLDCFPSRNQIRLFIACSIVRLNKTLN